MSQVGAHSQWRTRGSVAIALSRLYFIDNGVEPYELSLAGPTIASLTLNAFGEYEIDPLSTAIMATNAAGDLITFGG